MKTLTRHSLITFILFLGLNAFVQASIHCHTPRQKKIFKVDNQRVTFMIEGLNGRLPASLGGIRTRRKGNGFTKVVHFEGHKHTIHIQDTNNFSDLNDYLVIKSRRGHEITYPITCKRK